MKLRLLILIAATLAVSPAAGQTIKSLGYNTTNGNIVAATNVTFTNSVGFATNARAATRTNLELGATWLTNTSVTNFRTAIGALATNGNGSAVTNLTAANITGTVAISNGGSGATTAGGAVSNLFTPNTPLVFTTNGEVVANTGTNVLAFTNSLQFATNLSLGGTLTATGNVTLSGVGNTAPSQTASAGASLMTRDLVDVRNTALWVPIGGRANNTQTNGGDWAFTPWGVNTAGGCVLVPVTHKKLAAIYINIAFTNAPVAATFSVDVLFGNSTNNNVVSDSIKQSLTGTVTQVSGNRYKWVLDAPTTLTNANDNGGAYYINEIQFNNNSGDSLTTVAGDQQSQGYLLLTP